MTDLSLVEDTQIERPSERLHLKVPSDTAAGSLASFSWQPQRADSVWTQSEWTALCEHLHNDNGTTQFVMGFRDKDGCKKYVKSKKLLVQRGISWGWQSIAGSPKSRLAFVPYSVNERQQSRWGGMDFDAHQEGQTDRARELAWAAYRLLLSLPDVAVILETSGSGGWHVWVISPDFHDAREWIRLLKSVAATIGTVIASGVCEIFPPDSLPSQYGKGMRAPGSWNPSTDQHNEIVFVNTRTSLESVLSRKSKMAPSNYRGLDTHFPDTKKETSFSVSLYREAELLHKFGISVTATRNENLASLVGEVFHQFGHDAAQRLATAQFRQRTATTTADETEHMASFELLWTGLLDKWTDGLSAAEREKFTQLETGNERDVFRIVQSYARKANLDNAIDFPIVRDNMANRLGITGKGAAGIRDKLTKLDVIKKTADYVPNKSSARYKWLLAKT